MKVGYVKSVDRTCLWGRVGIPEKCQKCHFWGGTPKMAFFPGKGDSIHSKEPKMPKKRAFDKGEGGVPPPPGHPWCPSFW